MMNFGHFETELHLRYPDSLLYIRNMCDGGDTPGFRPHSGRDSAWAFPGADIFQTEFARISGSIGHLEYPDEWIHRHKADMIIGFFGHVEARQGKAGLDNFRAELQAFIDHSKDQKYNGRSAPQLALVGPTAIQDISHLIDVPDGKDFNVLLKLYNDAIKEVAQQNEMVFVDLFKPSRKEFATDKPLTIDGLQLTEEGYEKITTTLIDGLFGKSGRTSAMNSNLVHEAVLEKNWFWHNDFKIPNGVHTFGRRYNPFGPDNYPFEFRKIREMTTNRDTAIWLAAKGEQMDLELADSRTSALPPVETNFVQGDYGRGEARYLYGQEALDKLTVPEGYKIELFASEEQFPDLANPVQLSFDNKGRLWVAVMPTYPHWKPGDPKPNDKLIILEDTDGDFKADKQVTWVEGLHIPVGFEFAPEGVYVSQGTNLKLFTDTDGDDRADREEIIMSGFDDHDTHHVISAFCTDPSGAIYMGEGVFLHTNVETAYGTIRGTHGGFYRFSPQRRHLERTAQISIPNPWGIAFDHWGQPIFAETSGPAVRWMMPSTIKPVYARFAPKSFDLIEEDHKVRPTSGLEFISSRHFPDEVQGDLILNNSIGFLGTKQHVFEDDGTGFESRHRLDLVHGSDPNFRPVDMEFAPDGSLYLVDWHNVLIGHMQHNARDPLRDHVHGRIYRITYPSRPLVKPAQIDGAPLEVLLDHLKLPEYRSRYRAKREIREHAQEDVARALKNWVAELDQNDPEYEHHLLEGLWVSWGMNNIDRTLLDLLLEAGDYRARAAAVRVVRYNGHQLEDQSELLKKAASDVHGRVRLEAIVSASWLPEKEGLEILEEAAQHTLDEWMVDTYEAAKKHVTGAFPPDRKNEEEEKEMIVTHLKGEDYDQYVLGKSIYERDAYCGTCHQDDGQGLAASGFPPLAGTKWVNGSEERLIKLALKGLFGPIEVLGKSYPGQVPMTPYERLLNDKELAAILTYIRNSFGNEASVITEEKVAEVRQQISDKKGFYNPDELLTEHPLETE